MNDTNADKDFSEDYNAFINQLDATIPNRPRGEEAQPLTRDDEVALDRAWNSLAVEDLSIERKEAA